MPDAADNEENQLLTIGLKIDASADVNGANKILTLGYWRDEHGHQVYVDAKGFEESGDGAQAVAQMLMDTAEGILTELGVPIHRGFTLGQDAPTLAGYKTPERVQKAREDRAQRRHERKFRPHA